MMRVKRYRAAELTPWQRAWYDAGTAIGLPQLETLNDLDQTVGFAPEDNKHRRRDQVEHGVCLPRPGTRAPQPCASAGQAHVDRVIIERGRATGVEVVWDGVRRIVRAERIVVCGGTFNFAAVCCSAPGWPGRAAAGTGHPRGREPARGGREPARSAVRADELGGHAAHGQGDGAASVTSAGHPTSRRWQRRRQASTLRGVFDLHFLPYSPTHRGDEKRWSCGVAALQPRSRGHVRVRLTGPRS